MSPRTTPKMYFLRGVRKSHKPTRNLIRAVRVNIEISATSVKVLVSLGSVFFGGFFTEKFPHVFHSFSNICGNPVITK